MSKTRAARVAPMVHIGASKETVAEVRDAILAIVNVRADRDVLIAALDAIKAAAMTSHVNFTGNHLEGR